MQQVGPGPVIWWRADQPPTPRPILKAPTRRAERSGSRRLPFAALLLGAIMGLVLAHPERRAAAFDSIERAAELAGLGLQQVTLVGHRFTVDSDIFAALDLDNARTLLSFDARAAQARIERLPWIESASIDRVVPDAIDVRVSERVPFAMWRSGGRHWLIDRSGRKLQAVHADTMPQLLRVAGKGAAEAAAALSAVLSGFPQIARRVVFAERVDARQWTLHLADGTSVHLPAVGIEEALAQIPRLLDARIEGVKAIYLRASARVLVREHDATAPAAQAQQTRAGRT